MAQPDRNGPIRWLALDAAEPPREWRCVLVGVFLTALGTLLAELTLTRLFSVILFYHFAFLAISVALLGLGAGGLCSYFLSGWLERGGVWPRLAPIAAVNAVVTALVLTVILRKQFPTSFGVKAWLPLSLLYFAAMLPFFFAGIVLSVVLARSARLAGVVYFADLAGASFGCLLLIPILEWLGGPNTMLVAAAVWGLSAVFWSAAGKALRRQTLLWLAVPLLLSIGIGVNARTRFLDIRYAKGGPLESEVSSWWNSFSRVALLHKEGGEYGIQIDADAYTPVVTTPPERRQDWADQLGKFSAGIVYCLRPSGRVLVIGPGGGMDMARALSAGSRDVTGVEINPIIVRTIMRGVMRSRSFGLYDRPDVSIHLEDGRSFIRRSHEQYDVIQATLVDTWASTSSGAYMLTENNLYTVEAFQEYLRHLTPSGILSITRWEFQRPREALRLVALGLEALKREGIVTPSRHFLVLSDGRLSSGGTTATVLIKRTAFSEEEVRAVQEAVVPGDDQVQLLAAPGVHIPNAFSELLRAPDPERFYANYPFDIRPVDDNRPFFFFNWKSGEFLRLLRSREPSMDLKVNKGFALLLAILLLSSVAVAAFLLLPVYLTRRIPRGPGVQRQLLYFVAIGLAYMLAEIAFIQRFILFLGHPTYSLAVAMFSLVLSTALGSRLSQRWPEAGLDGRSRRWLIALAALLTLIGLLVVPLVTRLVGLPLGLRIALAAGLLVPPGLLMGTAFPSGLRLLRLSHPSALEWAWAMNAAASVLGSSFAIFISIQLGIWQTMAASAVCYLVAAFLVVRPLVSVP